MSDGEIDVKVQAKIAGLAAGFAEAQSVVKGAVGQIKSDFTSFNSVVDTVKNHWLAITALLGGGRLFKGVIDGTLEWTTSVVQLSKRLGITTEEASGLKVALDHLGISTDEYGGLVGKVTRQMRTNGQAFEAIGIKTKEANGEWRNSQAVMADIIEHLNKMKAGTDRNVAAQALMGARVGNITALLRLNSDMLNESAEKAEKLNLVIGPDGAAKVRAYRDAMADLRLIGKSLEVQIGSALIPTLTQLSSKLGSEGPQAANFFAQSIKFVAEACLEAWAASNALLESVKFLFILLTTPVDSHFLSTVTKAYHDMGDAVTKVNDKVLDGLVVLKGLNAGIGSKAPAVTGPPPAGDTLGGDALGKPKSDWLAEQREMWTLQKEGSKNVADDLLQEEVKFWEVRRKSAQAGSKDLRAIEAILAAARLKLAGDARHAAMIETQITRDAQLEQLDVEKQAILERQQNRTIDASKAAADLKDLAQRELAIKLDQLQAERALAEGDVVKQAEIDAKIAAAKRVASREIATIDKNMQVQILAGWEAMFSGITSAIDQSVNGIVQGTTTAGAALKNIWKSVTAEFISMGIKAFVHHRAMELAKTGATAQGTAQRVALESWASIKSVALSAWAAIRSIGIYAVEGAAAAFKSIAAIPFVGPFLAPAAAAAAGLAIGAFAGKIASAKGGYDIPAGINPVTQLHASEMVLPSHLADKIRGMTDAGSGGGFHFHAHGLVDGNSVKKFFIQHGDKIVAAVQRGERNFAFDEG